MKSELRLVRLVRTIRSRRAQSSTPSIATFAALAPGWDAQVGPFLGPHMRQVRMGERFGLVAEQKHDIARLGLGFEQLPAQARPVHRVCVLAPLQGVAGPSPAEIPL